MEVGLVLLSVFGRVRAMHAVIENMGVLKRLEKAGITCLMTTKKC